MASKSINGIILAALLLGTMSSAASVTSARASASDLPVVEHNIKFYIDPALLGDMDFAAAVLPKYVSDMNTVLAKNTRRRLVFDPQSSIIPAATKPQTDSTYPPLPTENFDIWAHVTATSYPISYGGYTGVDVSGAGVLAGLNWTRLYDPDALSTTSDVRDYTIQINHMLHELAHVFGAGMGEYYSLGIVKDSTDDAPLLNIDVNAAADPYWSDKPDFAADPLLRYMAASSRADYLSKVIYSSLTAAILNGAYRNGIPSFDRFTVQVVDRTGQPIPGAEVKVWNIQLGYPYTYTSTLLYDVSADGSGQVTLAWGGPGRSHNASNMLRLIKVYQDGVALPSGRYLSIFDLDIARLVSAQSSFAVTMQPANQPPSDITLSSAAIDENLPAGTVVGQLGVVDLDGGSSLAFSLCGRSNDASFQIVGSDLLSATTFDYETQSSLTLCLRADDGQGGILDKTMTVNVNDLPDPITQIIPPLPSSDGWVRESRAGSDVGGSVNAGSATVLLGQDAGNRRYRSVLAFNTAAIPDDAVITGATLKVRRQATTTTDPFATLGDLTLDLGSPLIGSSARLQAADFQAPAVVSALSVFASQPDPNGWYSVKLTDSTLSLLSLTGPTQLRLGFSGNSTAGADYIALYSGNASAVNRPVLVVAYKLP